MGTVYSQLSLEERIRLAELHRAGCSNRQIAAALDRSASSIGRELKRNAGSQPAGYRPDYAQQQTAARRWTGSKLERDAGLRVQVLDRLSWGWSPAQVAGRLAREAGHVVISHETIYRFVYAQQARTNDGRWRLYLPMQKSRRGWRPGKGGSPALHIKYRISIDNRPTSADDRIEAGHWEADFMLFSKYGQQAIVLHERTTRITALAAPPNRLAEPTAQQLTQMLEPLPEHMRRSLTFDNGTEFACHYKVTEALGLPTFFCDPHAPWQKGGVENAIGRLRRWLPRKTDLETLSPDDFVRLAQAYNHTPRQCLDFQTPAEVFSKVLHFKCESTSRLSPG
jgi:IS30 family transposase